jgi:site-specific recombinase XerD
VRSVVTLRTETTKGKKGGEIVLPEKVRRRVSAFLGWKKDKEEGVHDVDPLFASRGGGRAGARSGSRLSVRSAERVFEVWQARAGLDRRLNFHGLRHTFATKLLRETKNLRLVQIGIVRKSEIPKTGACHIFRHTAAMLMLEGGADIRYVQTMLGHLQLESTAIYTHVSILKLLEVYAATHPAARIGRAPAKAKAREEALARAEAADLLIALDEEDEEDAMVNGVAAT